MQSRTNYRGRPVVRVDCALNGSSIDECACGCAAAFPCGDFDCPHETEVCPQCGADEGPASLDCSDCHGSGRRMLRPSSLAAPMTRILCLRTAGSDVALVTDDPCAMIIGALTPGDAVKLPANLGGTMHKVIEAAQAPCPVRGCAQTTGRYRLDNQIDVYECTTHGFLWCSAPKDSTA